jgi:NADH:ubiquinone oxidoreductase subunit 3 (subunit A)
VVKRLPHERYSWVRFPLEREWLYLITPRVRAPFKPGNEEKKTMIQDLYGIAYFVIFAFVLAVVLLMVSFGLTYTSKLDLDKSSAYECGFNPFSETRSEFEVHFYLIAILFLLFDVEILYLFPLTGIFLSFSFSSYIYLFMFFVILLIGLVYEISRGVLNLSLINFVLSTENPVNYFPSINLLESPKDDITYEVRYLGARLVDYRNLGPYSKQIVDEIARQFIVHLNRIRVTDMIIMGICPKKSEEPVFFTINDTNSTIVEFLNGRLAPTPKPQ